MQGKAGAPAPALVAVSDQLQTALSALAPTMAIYRDDLIASGFTVDGAERLCVEFQMTLVLGRAA